MGKVAPLATGWVFLAVALVALAEPAVAGPVKPGRLKIRASAGHLVLGEQQQVGLKIAGPTAVERIRLGTNVGRVDGLKRVSPGRWTASYHCPSSFHPQVAIISAVSDGGADEPAAVGWTLLPLWGRGEAKVKTQRRVEVTVRIGERTFGPVRADGRGRARVKVIVPPGVSHGVDGRGREVDLELPPIPRLHAVVWPTRVVGVKPSRVRMLMLTIAPDGTVRGEAEAPRITGLDAAAPSRLGEGLWLARISVPAGKPGTLSATASLADGISTARVAVERLVGPPAKVALSAPATTDDDAPLVVRARVFDALGSPVDAASSPRASSPAGRLGPVSHTGVGEYAVRWLPPRWSSRERVTLRFVADGAAGEVGVKLGYPADAWRRRLRPYWFWTAVGVSSAVLISAVISRGIALDKSSEYKDPATSIERRRQLKDSGEPLTTFSSVAMGVGAAAVVGTAVIYYFTDFDHEQADPSPVSVTVGVAGGSLKVRF